MADNNLLVVEGPDDKHVLSNLLQYHKIPETFKIQQEGGIETLLKRLRVRLRESELEHLGIMVDADTDILARWQSLHDILTNAGYLNVPTKPQPGGTIIVQEDKPVVGIWLMPDNRLHGMLEDFIGLLVPSDDLLWDKANECLAQVVTIDRRFPVEHEIKARIHTWLAWQKEPGKPFGTAITARYLDPDAPDAKQLINWLQQLFPI
jgi:hypothetical protein